MLLAHAEENAEGFSAFTELRKAARGTHSPSASGMGGSKESKEGSGHTYVPYLLNHPYPLVNWFWINLDCDFEFGKKLSAEMQLSKN